SAFQGCVWESCGRGRAPREAHRSWGRTCRCGSDRRRAKRGCRTSPAQISRSQEKRRPERACERGARDRLRTPSTLRHGGFRAAARHRSERGDCARELLESRSSRERSPRCSPDRSELLRAKDAPENVLEDRTGLARIRGVGERVLEELAFPVARRTSERDAVELGDDRKRLATFAKRAGESAIGILDAAVENLAVQEVELDRETARRRGPAAAARARTAEELERARRDRSVEHIDRAR